MQSQTRSFRHGTELLRNLPEFHELMSVIGGIRQADIVAVQVGALKGKPVGAQKALNHLFKERLGQLTGWLDQVLLFPTPAWASKNNEPPPAHAYPDRRIDFMKNHLGVEIAFNNESYLERILFRLNVASEADAIIPAHVVHGGVIVVASEAVKRWGSMDPSVATFEGSASSLELVRTSFSVPLVLLGLFPDDGEDWSQPSPAFGKKQTALPQTGSTSPAEQTLASDLE